MLLPWLVVPDKSISMSTVDVRLMSGSLLCLLLLDLLLLLLPDRCPWPPDGESPLLLLLLLRFFSFTPCFSLDLLNRSADPPSLCADRPTLLKLCRGISSGMGSNSAISSTIRFGGEFQLLITLLARMDNQVPTLHSTARPPLRNIYINDVGRIESSRTDQRTVCYYTQESW